MELRKTYSLKLAFWKFLGALILGLLVAVIIPFCILLISVTLGFATYADYSERSAKSIAPIVAVTPDITEVELPVGIKYLRLDKNFHIIETTLQEKDLRRAVEYATTGRINKNVNMQYILVTRENEYVVLQYYIGSQFTNDWLNKNLPSPEILLYILIVLNCVLVCVVITTRFAKNLQTQLLPLFNATVEIRKQNLEFDVGHSNIKEFDVILLSFAKMKEELKVSLQQQWKVEEMQKEQIASLAHDLKTPLTVIQGNIDLLNETVLDSEQKMYTDYILQSSEQMKSYTKMLIDITRNAVGYELHIEKTHFYNYIMHIKKQIESLCTPKEIHLKFKVESMPKYLEIDNILIERAIMNVVSNALEYSKKGGIIYFNICYENNNLRFLIIDEGEGFSKEALQYACGRFYMADQSRNSMMHFGMGLYITDSIIKQHGGKVILENGKDTYGAKVTLIIPS